jgi:uncharacterized membrane protein
LSGVAPTTHDSIFRRFRQSPIREIEDQVMTMLIAAALFFLALHLAVAGTGLRDVVVRLVGEGPYLGLFSLASLGGIVWLAASYNAVSAQGSPVYWDVAPGVREAGIVVLALAFLLAVPGLLSANPTSVRQEAAAARPDAVRGVLRITRHPFLWGVALWAAVHLAANGDQASVIFFGTFLVLAVAGTYSIDAKRARKMGASWEAFAKQTSNIPFAAIIAGRNSLKAGEFADYRLLLAVLAFVAVLFVHAWLFSASPFPQGW